MEALLGMNMEDQFSLMSYLVPPLRLLSAAMWHVTEQKQVKHYGMLEQFVTIVTEAVPELLDCRLRAQLILGLRVRLLLEICQGKDQLDLLDLQPHLERIRAPCASGGLSEIADEDVERSEASCLDLIQTLISNPKERENFFENVFPVKYGAKFDRELQTLMEDFLIQLDQMMAFPDLLQTVSWLRACPSLLEQSIQAIPIPVQLKAFLKKLKANDHLFVKDSLNANSSSSLFISESTDTSVSGVNVRDGGKDYSHSSTEPVISVTATRRKRRREFDKEQGRVDEEEDEDEDQHWPVELEESFVSCNRYIDGSVGEDATDIHDKKRSSKCKRDDGTTELSFINHLGAYTEEEPYLTSSDASKVPWSDDETLSLIAIWGKDTVQQSLKDCIRNRHIFNLISKKMLERGFSRTAEQCHTRIKRLKMSFRQCQESCMRGEKPDWKFYYPMEMILCSKDSATNPEDSVTVSEDYLVQQAEDDHEVLCHVQFEGTKNIPWTHVETQTLITIWGQSKTQKELRGVFQNGHIFAMISKKMATHGYVRTGEQCHSRIKRLKLCFKQCHENNNTEGKEQVQFKFYKQMEKIMTMEESISACAEYSYTTPIKTEESAELDFQMCEETEPAVSGMDDRKKVAWSDAETLILLQLWGDEQVQQNLQRCPHNSHIYSEISEKLNAHGYPRSAEQCHTRIKRLKISYRQCRDNLSFPEGRIEFKFYDLMEAIFQNNASTEERNQLDIKSESPDTSVRAEQTDNHCWSDSEIEALIDVWAEADVQKALRGCVRNDLVFSEIAEKLNTQGCSKSPEQCSAMIKNLRQRFQRSYESKKCGVEKIDCKHYEKLEPLVLGDAALSADTDDHQDIHDVEGDGSDRAAAAAAFKSVRKMSWSDRETQALLEIWGEGRVQHSLQKCSKNGHIYRYISRRMMALGFNRTGKQCHTRVNRLKIQFYYDRKEECKFYNQLEEVLVKDRTSDDQDTTSEVESISDSDSESPSGSKPCTDGTKLTWGDAETQTLISIWGSDPMQESLRERVKRTPVFQYIALNMAEKGYSRSGAQCRSRMKRLRASYRQCLENHRNVGGKVKWKFFRQLQEIYAKHQVSLDETESGANPASDEPENASRSVKAEDSVHPNPPLQLKEEQDPPFPEGLG